jgi:CheY-specific phosphatase CheX
MEDFTEIDADSLDAVSEFLNLTNGLYVSARSDDGIEMDLDLPMMYPSEQSVVGDDGTAFRLELDIGAGTLSVIFSVDVDVFVE